MQDLMTTELWDGTTLAELFTLEFAASVAGSVLGALTILVLGFFIAGWARKRVTGLSRRYRRLDVTLFSFLGNLLRYVILAFTAVFVLNTFGIQTTSIVALIGAAGLAVGLALQGTLSNVAAGVMLILFRPFKIGDSVEIGGRSGTVVEISLNFTELSSSGNVQVIIPNGQIWGNVITNYSAYDTRRAEWVFRVSFAADLDRAETVIRDTIMADPRARTAPAPLVQVNDLGAASADLLVRVWCASADHSRFQADMKRAVIEALDAAGIQTPYPLRPVPAPA